MERLEEVTNDREVECFKLDSPMTRNRLIESESVFEEIHLLGSVIWDTDLMVWSQLYSLLEHLWPEERLPLIRDG